MKKIPHLLLSLLFLLSTPVLAQEHARHDMPASGAAPSLPVHMKLRSVWPIKAGESLDVQVYLWTDKGPLRLEDMDTVHTKKMHLFLLSPDFKDFYHVHPYATGGEGEFRFTFKPTRKVPLRAWAEFSMNGKRHVIVRDLDEKTDAIQPPPPSPQVIQAETSDMVFTIHFNGEIRAGKPASGRIQVMHKNSHLPYTELEPVLGAFAHIAAFSSDYQTLYHAHPDGPEVKDDNARGGPSLPFTLLPEKPGMMKIFVQVKTRGMDLLAPFIVRVNPEKRPAPLRPIEEETPLPPPDAAP